MSKTTKKRKTTRPIRARLATVSPQVGPIDDVLTSPSVTVSMASLDDDLLVVAQRLGLHPDRGDAGTGVVGRYDDRVGGGLDLGADDSIGDVVDLVTRVVGDGLELHTTLELDPVVEPTSDQAHSRERDDDRGDRVPALPATDEVDGLLAGVEVCSESDSSSTSGLPSDGLGFGFGLGLSKRRQVRGARDRARRTCGLRRRTWSATASVTIGLVKKNTMKTSITVLRPSANAKPLTTPIAKMNKISAARNEIASAARIVDPRSCPSGLDRSTKRSTVADLVTQSLEVDDERVGGDTDRDDQSRDSGQRQSEAVAMTEQNTEAYVINPATMSEAMMTMLRPR